MISRKTIAAILSLILITIVITSLVGYGVAASQAPSKKIHGTFTLAATGTAYDKLNGKWVDVTLKVQGSADGNLRTVLMLRVKGGDAKVGTYDALTPSSGVGVLIPKGNYMHLVLRMTSRYYGGTHTVWVLMGKLTALYGDHKWKVDLRSNRVLLPLDDYPMLTKLTLTGTLIVS